VELVALSANRHDLTSRMSPCVLIRDRSGDVDRLVPLTLARIAMDARRATSCVTGSVASRCAVGDEQTGGPRPVLVHAVSAGEMNAADPIVTMLGRLERRVIL
jgi:3-deoxy-D-manno-octulosonic-acid transferase